MQILIDIFDESYFHRLNGGDKPGWTEKQWRFRSSESAFNDEGTAIEWRNGRAYDQEAI